MLGNGLRQNVVETGDGDPSDLLQRLVKLSLRRWQILFLYQCCEYDISHALMNEDECCKKSAFVLQLDVSLFDF